MDFTGTDEVLRRLFLYQHLLQKGDPRHADIRPTLIICGGSMRGVYGGGQVTALSEFGLTHVFDHAIGISTGAPTVAYFLAGQAREGTSIYYTECTQPHFISIHRMLWGRRVMDVDWLSSVFHGQVSNKPLDQHALRKSRTQFWTVATEVASGALTFLGTKEVGADIIDSIKASLALPGVSHGEVRIGEKLYCDGNAYPLPIKEVTERFQPTDILVLANCSLNYHRKGRFQKWLMHSVLMRASSPSVRRLFANSREQFWEDVDYLRTQGKSRHAIVWSDGEVGSYTTDPDKLKAAADRAEMHIVTLLEKARADVI